MFLSLIIDLKILIPAVIAQIFNPIAELLIPEGIPNKQTKSECETYPVTAEAKISVQDNLNLNKLFCASYSSIHFTLIK